MLNFELNQKNISDKKFLIYGFGLTGKSVLHFFKKKKIKKFTIVDDKIKRFKISPKSLSNKIKETDFIIMSPGIDIFNSKRKRYINKSKKKILSDLDLFSIFYPKNELLMITGTNGKSTTCKMLEHILKYNKKKIHLGGNIGMPILNINPQKNSKIIDLGCSTGSFLNLVYERHKKNKNNLKFLGFDEVNEMIRFCHKKYSKKKIKFRKNDINKVDMNDSCIISLFYTLQFISPAKRQILVNKIYKSLNWGGALFLIEKVRASDARFQDIMNQFYIDFKLS